ncbi:efflux RND transporter periplasmic adaptor subunit [Paenibacillus hemerocallicola]|uniref:Efflux RND transporter periplasmic adaptor subunit n=1 Tax=Paenibacillus hemerocallicola TaxID=1172614 RepID=A0A5C4TBM0_9BACL|nr:efflux RND transporter periplasmic adaptor subunit [Paenibacillus hemerocallicola]TNJ66272.1 efflux RND transporter periplasmic adaptor subunit [Paenibacillus hemerocallicola]
MALKRRTKWLVVLAVVLVAGGGGTYAFISKSDKPTSAAQSVASTIKVQKGNIRLSVSGTSQFATQNLQNITAPADGTIKTLKLARSQPVKQGDILVEVSNATLEASLKDAITNYDNLVQELNDLTKQQQNLRIVAPTDGKLSLGNLDVGSTLNKNVKVGTVTVNSTLIAKIPFPLEEAAQFKAGDAVDLTITGYSLTKTGKVQSVGKELKADASGNRLVDVEIAIENDGTMDAGMDATGSVILNGREIKGKGTAKLEAIRTVAFLSETSGTISELRKKTGDAVKAGEVIAVVVNDTLKDSIASKQASVDRQKNTVEQAQKRVDELTVRAPFDGVFSTDFANQRQNVLARFPIGAAVDQGALFGGVASLDVMTLPIQVDELDLSSIKPGLKAEVSVDAISGRKFAGEVLQVSTVGTTTNGVTYYDAIVAVENKEQALKYGMTGTAEILIQDKKDVLTLPVEALRIQRGSATVTIKKPDGTTQENVPVKIGIRSKTSVEITEGLKEGDEVVLPTRRSSGNGSQQQIDALRQQFQQGGGFPAGGGGAAGPGGGGGTFQIQQGGGGGGGGGR